MSRRFDDVMLGSIELFCAAAERGSFTAAATALGLTPAAVSRSVARLEQRLGVQLFTRTTRQVALTEAGREYFAGCRDALGQLAEAERAVTGRQQRPSGKVRISLPTPYGHHRILPLLPRFRLQHPDVEVEAHVSNRNVDFTSEGFDLAVRSRTLPDSGLIARKLEDAALVVVAAPSYLRRCGTPKSPDDLARHDCIQFLLPRTGQPVTWLFQVEGQTVEHATTGGLQCAEDLLATVTLARHGGGLLQTYRFIVEDDLQRGTLKPVLERYAGCSRPMSLLHPAQRHVPLRVRVLIDFLVAEVARQARPAAPAARRPLAR
jgi:DNA-binding transcriptional LysR family regulator